MFEPHPNQSDVCMPLSTTLSLLPPPAASMPTCLLRRVCPPAARKLAWPSWWPASQLQEEKLGHIGLPHRSKQRTMCGWFMVDIILCSMSISSCSARSRGFAMILHTALCPSALRVTTHEKFDLAEGSTRPVRSSLPTFQPNFAISVSGGPVYFASRLVISATVGIA